jgi:transposase-like protein
MVVERVCCPHCQSEEVVKYGATTNGKPRFRCQPAAGCGRTFIRAYAYQGRRPLVKQQIVEMTLNGSGVRDIARVLQISPMTVIGELKKRRHRWPTSTMRWSRGAVPKRSP